MFALALKADVRWEERHVLLSAKRRSFATETLWNELFPAEQARIVGLLVERVDLQPDGIDLRLRVEGLTSLCSELRGGAGACQEAA
jgi:hypothetical protein